MIQKVEQVYKISYPEVIQLTDKDINLIKKHYDKAFKNANFEHLEKLGQRIEKVLKIQHREKNYTQFIEIILKDYYHNFKDD